MKLDRSSLFAIGLFLSLAALACSSAPEPKEPPLEAPGAAKTAQAEGGAAPAAPGEQGRFQESVQEAELRKQRNAYLVERHVSNAQRLLDNGDLASARVEIDQAHELAPADAQVVELRNRIAAAQGERGGEVGVSRQDIEEREKLRSQQARLEAEQALVRAREFLAMREFERANAEVAHAEDVLRWSPYGAEWADLRQQADELKTRVQTDQATYLAARKKAQEEEALEAMRREEVAARSRREEAIEARLAIARDAFLADDFRGARLVAEQVLLDDPRNDRAAELRDAATAALDQKVEDNYVRERKDRFRQMRREDLEVRTPYTKVLTLPSREFWETISKLRDPATSIDVVEGETEDDRIVREQLRTLEVPAVKLEGVTDIEEVATYLRNATGIPILVTPSAREKITAASVTFNIDLPYRTKAETALKEILRPVPDVTYLVKNGAVLITTAEDAVGRPVPRAHDVNDLVFGLTDFQGPRLNRLRVPGARSTGPQDENPFGATLERKQQIPPEEITTLIKDTI
ncbi:MAG TPA: hypothetical protein VKE69_00315, partial [Planctomycetota bacterium]|nr:hypothetical protein [Planctomycetota bacterium]